MQKRFYCFVVVIILGLTVSAQHPFKHWTDAMDARYDMTKPIVNYLLTIDTSGFSSFTVEMKIKHAADTFHIAMVAHPEYDDRYWKYVNDLSVKTDTGPGKIIREDSALWKVICHGDDVVIHYKVVLPATAGIRSSWKAYMTSTGGLIGGPHSFMYIVGSTLMPSYVSLQIPSGWQIVTGLQPTSDPKTFFAPSTAILIDDPIFIGKFSRWNFTIAGTPHCITYWPLTPVKVFDSAMLLRSIEKIVEQAALLFGRLPYREYYFMLQDGAVGSLEHNNSVTVGAPSDQLMDDMTGILSEIAHEYFHTWNLVRIRPMEYGDVSYQTPPLSKGLWFSEGLTIFYADLLLRRAGLRVFDSTRLNHLETLIRRYSASPVYTKYTAEKISLASYGPTGMLGDYSGSTHLQGEVLGTMLDLVIRHSTDGKRSMDDVMRKMLQHFSGEKGFVSKDIEQAVSRVCGCNVHTFFQDYVYGNKAIDFNKYLTLIGLRYTMEWKDVLDSDNKIPDLRVFTYQVPGETALRIGITNPASAWGKAGIHTGDIIRAINGKPLVSQREFRPLLRNVKIGDNIVVDVERPTGNRKINVLIAGYQQPVVRLIPLDKITEKQQTLYEQWLHG